jgi:hypothetical protein
LRNAAQRSATQRNAAQVAETRIPFAHPFPVFPLISRLHLNGAYGTRASATRRNAERMGGDSSVETIVPLGGGQCRVGQFFSLYTQESRVYLVVVIYNVCNTHGACATVRHGAHRVFSLHSRTKSRFSCCDP